MVYRRGNRGKIVFENTKIDAHTEGTVIIDISQAYDVEALEGVPKNVKEEVVYSVADGVVTGIGFENRCGNYVVIDLGGGLSVKYGHLKEILVEEDETVVKGQEIAELGKTGMATGPNLLLAVYMDGEAVNPLKE